MEITKETGFEAVNARSIAGKLPCYTRPIFTCYENMDEFKKEFLDFAYKYFEQYVTDYCDSTNAAPSLIHPLSYIDFAREETHLFKLLFINDMDLSAFQDNIYDITLLLGPLYHLYSTADKQQALGEPISHSMNSLYTLFPKYNRILRDRFPVHRKSIVLF